MNSDKITHIYMMPGLAASAKIFENIDLNNKMYSVHKLDWIQPKKMKVLSLFV